MSNCELTQAEKEFRNVLVTALAIGFFIGAIISIAIEETVWKTDALDRGYAHYDSATGKWEWNDDTK